MAETGENYTTARRAVIAGRDPGQPPVALRVYLNPHVDLELTDRGGPGVSRPLMSRASGTWRTGCWRTGSRWPGPGRPGSPLALEDRHGPGTACRGDRCRDTAAGTSRGPKATGSGGRPGSGPAPGRYPRHPAGPGGRSWRCGGRPAPRRAGGADRQTGTAGHPGGRLTRKRDGRTKGPGILRAEDRGWVADRPKRSGWVDTPRSACGPTALRNCLLTSICFGRRVKFLLSPEP